MVNHLHLGRDNDRSVPNALRVLHSDSPLRARWLTEEDRFLTLERARENQQGFGNKKFRIYRYQAVMDPLTWAFLFFRGHRNHPEWKLNESVSLLIEPFGFPAKQSLLYGTLGGAVESVPLI